MRSFLTHVPGLVSLGFNQPVGITKTQDIGYFIHMKSLCNSQHKEDFTNYRGHFLKRFRSHHRNFYRQPSQVPIAKQGTDDVGNQSGPTPENNNEMASIPAVHYCSVFFLPRRGMSLGEGTGAE